MADNTKKNIVILGGGIAGLSMGYQALKKGNANVTVLEKASKIGGLCGSFEHNGFVLDYGAHKLYSAIPGNLERIKDAMTGRLIKLEKRNRIFLNGHLLDYPLRLTNFLAVMGLPKFLGLGFGYARSLLTNFFKKSPPQSYEEYMIRYFGRSAYHLVFEPLADKVWGKPSELHPEMARTRVPSSGGAELILKLLGLKKETAETNADFFFYPRQGFGDFPKTLQKGIEAKGGQVLTDVNVTQMTKTNDTIQSVEFEKDGKKQTVKADYVISTIPLPALSRLALPNQNGEGHAVDKLQYRHLVLVYIFVNKPTALKDQWIFFPERKFLFSRIFEQKQMNPDLGPKDKTAICCDFTCDADDANWASSDSAIVEKCIDGLVEGKFIDRKDVTDSLVLRTKNFYPRYDLEYVDKIEGVANQLKQVKNLLLTGRLGMYNYNNSDHCFDMAHFISERLTNDNANCNHIWDDLVKHVATYKIVD